MTTETKDLKQIANRMKSYMNGKYRNNISYTPDMETRASVSVSKYVEMSQVFKDAVELPGLPFGVVSCIYAKPDTGKTTLLMEGIVACQKQGILPILILTEFKFDFNRIDLMGGDSEAILVIPAESIEDGYTYIESILRDLPNGKISFENEDGQDEEIDLGGQDVFLFWDSIGNTLSEKELDLDIDDWDKSMMKPAKAIKTLTRRANKLLGKVRDKAGILFLNQSYTTSTPQGFQKEVPYGGEGIPYTAALVIRLRKIKDIKMTSQGKDVVIGLQTKVQVIKNHIHHRKPTIDVFVVATGIIEADKKVLDEYKKSLRSPNGKKSKAKKKS